MNIENTGLIIKEQAEDYIAGTLPYREVCNNWALYLPADERQHGLYFDTMACATFSALNCIETQINYFIVNKLVTSEVLKDLDNLGFIVNGKFECSDRFTAKMSGTTRKGNYLQKVWDSIKHDGLLPEKDYPYPRTQRTPVFSWDNYYKEISEDLKYKAKQILRYFEFSYEWTVMNNLDEYSGNELNELKRQLKHAPLQLASPLCNWGSGLLEPCGKTRASHATMIYSTNNIIRIFDHYNPFRKTLSLKYIMPWVMKGVVTLKTNNKKMKLVIERGHIYLIYEAGKFGWSIPEPKQQIAITEHFKKCGIIFSKPEYKDLTGYHIIHGASQNDIKNFFNFNI